MFSDPVLCFYFLSSVLQSKSGVPWALRIYFREKGSGTLLSFFFEKLRRGRRRRKPFLSSFSNQRSAFSLTFLLYFCNWTSAFKIHVSIFSQKEERKRAFGEERKKKATEKEEEGEKKKNLSFLSSFKSLRSVSLLSHAISANKTSEF